MTQPLNFKYTWAYDPYDYPGQVGITVYFNFADDGYQQAIGAQQFSGFIGTVADHPNDIFTNPLDMANYYFSSAASAMLSNLNGTVADGVTYSMGNLVSVWDSIAAAIAVSAPKAYQGITVRNNAFPIFKSAVVSSGFAVFYLTDDGTSTGAALFPNGIITESINTFVSDATASYQMSYALTNSNKTLTVTTNKLGTANILTGILGQVAANGATVRLQVWGY